jgi:2'-hydroxyisoflavone reductase
MKILLLGGTRFLGRHCVDAALERGFEVTLFTRGRQPNPWGDAVTHLVGDRDPDKAPGLTALATGQWDAVIDTSGYVPRCVRASVDLLRDRAGSYLFVSSVSVYADASVIGLDEESPTGVLPDPASEDVAKYYGPLKAACEREVEQVFGERAIVVRPGLIVGPYDATDRFGYWVARFALPEVLPGRSGDAVVPEPPERAIQVIDARDLAILMLELVVARRGGTFNACSPAGRFTMNDVVTAARSVGGPQAPRAAWIAEALLLEHKVEPWVGLPLWLPTNEAEYDGFMHVDCGRAVAAGMPTRPLEETIAATAAWLARRTGDEHFAQVLDADTERAILSAAASAQPR